MRGDLLLGVFVVVMLAACTSHSSRDAPSSASPYAADWVKQQIAEFEAGVDASRVDGTVVFDGAPLYLIRSPCCDLFDYLYTSEGKTFCAPSGGFTGRGDGKCPPGLGAVSPREQH